MINIGQDIKHITNGHLICDEFEIWIQKYLWAELDKR